ncbi:MAG: SDR family oxidoreductase [Planctomycetaceae bacterium]|nr:SDR family oxidoreductase [Planctomycetaceae bacterium]
MANSESHFDLNSKDSNLLAGKPVALITGAARGIGRETALEFARRGYDLGLLDILPGEVQSTSSDATKLGAECVTESCDLNSLEAAQASLNRIVQRFGRLDVLVNNAAWREIKTMREISIDSWERTLRICLTTPAFLARWAAEAMERQNSGVIINVCSIMSRRGGGVAAAYSAAKGGIEALTYELASLYGRRGIRVLAISPGAIDTELSGDYPNGGHSVDEPLREWSTSEIPLGRWGNAVEIARVIVMLSSADASYVTGTNVTVDGGWSQGHFPSELLKRMKPDQF